MCCASNSASTTCSVKNFEPTTILFFGPLLHAVRKPAAATSARKDANNRRTLNHLQSAFEQSQRSVRRQCQQSCRNRTRKNHCVAHHRDSAKNKCPKPTRAYRRGDRRNADSDYRRRSNPGKNHAQCERKT